MNKTLGITVISVCSFVTLIQLPSCNRLSELLLSDLELESVTLLNGPGISTADMRIVQGVHANVSAMVFINSHATPDQEDTFDRNLLAVRLSMWNTDPDDQDTSDGLEEYHDTISYREDIGYVPPAGGPLLSVDIGDDEADNADFLAPHTDGTLVFPTDLETNPQLLEDQLLFLVDRSHLDDMALGELAGQIKSKHIPRLRYVQNELNSHDRAAPLYEAKCRAKLADRPIVATHLVFTFEIPTHQLKRGQWELRIEADPDDLIEELTNANNASNIIELELIAPPEGFGWEMIDTGPEEFYYATCDMTVGQPDDYGPALLRAEYKRLDDDSGPWRFWEQNHVLEANQDRMRASEFWGPYGRGEYWDGDSYQYYYPCSYNDTTCDPEDRAPSPGSIENVIILAAGYAQCNDINIVTGQPGCGQVDGYADGCGGGSNFFCDDYGQWELLYTSIAARIILNEPSYATLYNSRNTLLTLVNQHEYDMALCGGCWWDHGLHCAGCGEDAYAQIRNAWLDYIKDRTDNLRNVRTIILAGQSRGGVFAAALADNIKRHLLAGNFGNENPVRIVVATNAAANTESDESLGDYDNWSLGGSGWGDNAHCHDLEAIWAETSPDGAADVYPLYWKQLVDDGIVDKPFIHTGDCGAGEGRPEFHDERIGSLNGDTDAIENFYTQVFTNMGHTSIRVEYRTENGPDQLRFIYEKAWLVGFFDFEMVDRYGFEEYTCE